MKHIKECAVNLSIRMALSAARAFAILAVVTLAALGLLAPREAGAREFVLAGAPFELKEVTTNVSVYFSSMRYNRGANQWNVEVLVSNKTAQAVTGPLVLLVDSLSGSSGALGVEGTSGGQAFWELTGQMQSGVLRAYSSTTKRTISLAFSSGSTPRLSTRAYAAGEAVPMALGFARSLNEAGQPLPGVTIEETGPGGTSTNGTDPAFGVATLGHGSGPHIWKFSKEGYLPVWRSAELDSNSVTLVPSPWLTRRGSAREPISTLTGGSVTNETLSVAFKPGSVTQSVNATVTPLTAQTLPGFLPRGWSPLQAFWLEFDAEVDALAEAKLTTWDMLRPGETAALIQWQASEARWIVADILLGVTGSSITARLQGAGAYAVVVPDAAPTSPPSAQKGNALEGIQVSPPNASDLLGFGRVVPASSPASLIPELVTGIAQVDVTNRGGSLPSGTVLRGEVSQLYRLQNGAVRVLPTFDCTVVGYKRPAPEGYVRATFPMRPILLFGPDQLDEATVRADMFAPAFFTGGVLDTRGGVVADGPVRVVASPGTLTAQQAIQLRSISTTNFVSLAGSNLPIVAAFELGIGGLREGSELQLQATGVPSAASFVLARVLARDGLYGLEPRARLHSNTNGILWSDEPQGTNRLPGFSASGQYVLLKVEPAQALIQGVARDSQGRPAAGLPVQIAGQPWLAFSELSGRYRLLGGAGQQSLTITDVANGDGGSQSVTVPTDLGNVTLDVATAVGGFRVASVNPDHNSTNVALVASVQVNFNRQLNPGSLANGGLRLVASDQMEVPASVSLNLAGSVAVLLPQTELEPGSGYTVVVSTNLVDVSGRPISGQTIFAFTTVPKSNRDPAAQLIIYEPGATNLSASITEVLPGFVPGTNSSAIVIHGTPGAADPGVPVVVANEASGETTTVISKADGSFTTWVNGTETDFISATFVGLNGSRLYVPVTKQIFDDGSVGLYQQGGVLQTESSEGAIQVTIPANALPSRSKFKLDALSAAVITNRLGGVTPDSGLIAGSGLNINVQGPLPTLPVQVRFPVNLRDLGYPADEAPTNAAAVLTAVQTNQDAVAFRVMDQLVFHPRSAGTNVGRARLDGPSRLSGGNDALAAGFLDTSIGLMMPALGLAGQVAQIGFNQVLLPLLLGARPVVIKGKVAALPTEIAEQLAWADLASRVINAQTGLDFIDMPYQLAQMMGLENPLQGPTGVLGQFVQVASFAYTQQQRAMSQPLGGALVSVRLSGGPLVVQPGRIFPGMVYAVSGQDGYFLTVAPAAAAQYLVRATHPRFQDILEEPVNPLSWNPLKPGDLSLAGAVYKDFYFQVANIDQTPPTISIANTPVQPAPGQSCKVIVTASHPSARPRIGVRITSVGTTDLITGRLLANVQYSMDNIVKTDTPNNGARWEATLTVSAPVLVKLSVSVLGNNGDQSAIIPYGVAFTGPTTPIANPRIPPPMPDDNQGPLVVAIEPLDNGFLGDDGTIVVHFNKPIDTYVTTHLQGISLGVENGSSANLPVPRVTLGPEQRTLLIQYPGLSPSGTYRLTLSAQSIRDLAAQPLDQLPTTATPDSFSTTFRTPPTPTAELPGLANGKGTLLNGKWLYALDQAPQGNALLVYDVSTPLRPTLVTRFPLFGVPRDMALVRQYSYLLNIRDGAPKTNDLLIVVGGDLDARIDKGLGTTVSTRGQFLWVLNMANPAAPDIIASPILTYRIGSVVPKVRWQPPYLFYQEFGADIQHIGVINLQELIVGFNSTRAQKASFPTPERRNEQNSGQDKNGDGDYVDEGETLPIPDMAPSEFYGKKLSYVLQGTTQKILDFATTRGARTLGVTLTRGITLDSEGRPRGATLPPSYRTIVANGFPLSLDTPTLAWWPFENDEYPRWVNIIESVPVTVGGKLVTLNLALVSINDNKEGKQKLAVLDITVPTQPRLLNTIVLDSTLLGGNIQSVNARGDGLLELTGDQNIVLLHPTRLAITDSPADQPHPAVISVVPGAGVGTRSLAVGNENIYSVAFGSRGTVVQTAPPMAFVSFPENGLPVDASTLRLSDEAAIVRLMATRRVAQNALAPARFRPEPNVGIASSLEPPNAALHYHVLLVAPGATGSEIGLGLESLNMAGIPLSNPGRGFPPVRAVGLQTQTAIGQTPRPNCGAPIKQLAAYRVSDDPKSQYYNIYLSQPFALVCESMTLEEIQRVTGVFKRQVLLSGYSLRAFIDADQSGNLVIGPFAAKADQVKKRVYPIASTTAYSVNRDYLLGNNPPPPMGGTPFEDTFGAIQAHSGEVRTPDVDMMLPSPHMQIMIMRTIGNQDNYEGPFGVGWDFNYNQRLTVLDPLVFPQGLQMPVVVRDTAENSDIAGTQDVLFNNGEGRTHQFRWISTNMPPEYVSDPLVKELKYEDYASDYYLPQPGMFDLLVKFHDGRFERLTPFGIRYRYAPDGRLEMVTDKFPKNRHELHYDSSGYLVRIDDRSVSGPRFVKFGYFRTRGSDADFDPALDTETRNSFLIGKICRLLDYSGRDVLFEYTEDGFLSKRLGVEVAGENGGYSGRGHTFYTYKDCTMTGVLAGEKGFPLVAAVTDAGADKEPVAKASTGIHGTDQIEVPRDNSAMTVAKQKTGVTMGDGVKVERHFDARGYVTRATATGPKGDPASEVYSNTVDGLRWFARHPEGNSERTTYDSENPVFRSRGNTLRVVVSPGPRGGQGYTEEFSFDSRYNMPSGSQVNANNFQVAFALSADGRTVKTIDYGNGHTREYSFNTAGQVTRVLDERGVETTKAYDANTGFCIREATGDITTIYGFDGGVPSQHGMPASLIYAEGLPTRLKYNNMLQPVDISRGDFVTTTAFDEFGHGVRHVELVGEGKRWESVVNYNEVGFVTNAVMNGVEINGTPGSAAYSYAPDSRMRVATMTRPDGSVQKFNYDSRGNVTSWEYGSYKEEMTYDLNNNQTSVKRGGDVVAEWRYDGLDRATNVIRYTGASSYVLGRSFFPNGELRATSATDATYGLLDDQVIDEIDALGRPLKLTVNGTTISPSFQYEYKPLSVIIKGPRMTASTTWDKSGTRVAASAPNFKMTMRYNGNGRTTRTDREEDGVNYLQTYDYDDLDNQTAVSDGLGKISAFGYRADGNQTSITDANNHTTTISYTSLGEIQQKQRADGMTTLFKHDAERRLVYEGDPVAGFSFGFDAEGKMTNSTLRNGASIARSNFDSRNMPRTVNLPGGGVETVTYDLQQQVLSRKTVYQNTTSEAHYSYDGMQRVRAETYTADGGPVNNARYDFDKAGMLLSTAYTEDGVTFGTANTYYPDATRKSVTYPSGFAITEYRDEGGRLTGVSDAEGSIVNAASWAGRELPIEVQLGKTMQMMNYYDPRGRLTGRRVKRLSDGAVLMHMRYQYDANDNITTRQYVHRGGRADVFGFDAGDRLAQEVVGVVPTNAAGSGPALYQRSYAYHASGLDYLVSSALQGPMVDPPVFATNWTAHNDFLLPAFVDGLPRATDAMGHVSQATLWVRAAGAAAPQPVSATLQHDGQGRLVRVTRQDGVRIENTYQPSGLRSARKVFQNGTLSSYSTFVYDEGTRLLEEYDRTGQQPALVGRYFYGTGDSPVAADLWDGGSRQLKRYYFLRDEGQSVVALADEAGTVVERTWYDAFGQPVLERKDSQAPAVQRVVLSDDNTLLVALSESVLAPLSDPGGGGGLVATRVLSGRDVLSVRINSSNVTAQAVLQPSLSGYKHYSVLKLVLDGSLAGSNIVDLTFKAGVAADEWGNVNSQTNFSFGVTNAQPGAILLNAGIGSTAPQEVARSITGSSILFHGQYFDYDQGLIYLRSRHYDPYSGMWFEPDPMGYQGSVNHYAAMGNNPVSMRDPTGLLPLKKYYNKIARKADGVDDTVLAARSSSAGEGFIKEGFGDHNFVAIIGALREYLPPPGSGVEFFVSLVAKYQSAEALVRQGANWAEFEQKHEKIVNKSKNGEVWYRNKETGERTRYIPDVDGLWIKIGMKVGNEVYHEIFDYHQVEAFRNRANEITDNLASAFRAERATKPKGGWARMWERATHAFKHGFSANLMEEIGMPHYKEGNRGKSWLEGELRAKVKKIPDGMEITLRGTQDSFTLDPLRKVTAEESTATFKETLKIFHQKMAKESIHFDPNLYERVTQEMKNGRFDIEHFPIGGKRIGLH